MKTVPLGEICDVQIGKTPKRAESRYWANGTHPWLSIKDMDQGRHLGCTRERITTAAVDELNCRRVEPGTVLLSFKLSIGKVGIASTSMFTNEAIAHLPIVDERLDRDFLYWALRTIPLTVDADRAAMGSTLNKAKLKQLPIPLPPIEEQRRIASVLDAADELRTKRRRALAKLDTLTQAIFIEMTEGFGADQALGPHLDFLTSGARGWAKYYTDSGARFIRSLDVQNNSIGADDIAFVEPPDSAEAKRIRIHESDVLLTVTGSRIGRSAVAPADLAGAFISQHVAILRTNDGLDPDYLSRWLSHPSLGQRQIAARQYGQTKPGLNFEQIRAFRLPVPSAAEQARIVESCLSVERLGNLTRDCAGDLDTLFASLQQRAFAGEL